PPLEPHAKPRNSSGAGCAEAGWPIFRAQTGARRRSSAQPADDGQQISATRIFAAIRFAMRVRFCAQGPIMSTMERVGPDDPLEIRSGIWLGRRSEPVVILCGRRHESETLGMWENFFRLFFRAAILPAAMLWLAVAARAQTP